MKAILKFNLPKDNEDFQLAANAWKYHLVIGEFDQRLRSMYKHEDKETIDTYDCRQMLHDILSENGINIDGDPIIKIKKPSLIKRILKKIRKLHKN